ncbi:MAG: helix-turn-helix transcriptional regulator [bacterium]|nr:helix-turn-helix transcriptional regulator [bacterium]
MDIFERYKLMNNKEYGSSDKEYVDEEKTYKAIPLNDKELCVPEYTSDYNRDLGNRIRYNRKLKGLTIKELADKVGLHFSTAQKYEAGKIKNVDISLIQKFADALDIEDSVLLGWNDENKEASKTIASSLDINTIDYKFMKIYSSLTDQQKEALFVIASQLKKD